MQDNVFIKQVDAHWALSKMASQYRPGHNVFHIEMGGTHFYIVASGYAEAAHLLLCYVGVKVEKIEK